MLKLDRINSTAPQVTINNVDRRAEDQALGTLWDKLNFSQQYSVCSLGQFGYLLTYVRYINNKAIAVLTANNKVATIDPEGLINVNPNIILRG